MNITRLFRPRILRLLLPTAIVLVLAACQGQLADTLPASTLSNTPTPAAVAESEEVQGATTPSNASSSAEVQPIEVTYFTPAQGEGPYYPVEKLADRDNDLTVLDGATSAPAGQIIEFSGRVYDANGLPVEGLVVEVWQTDDSGIYLHPGDPNTAQRDPNFQFYGEAVTAADGGYSFRTILPGHYEPRPRHIHAKVKQDGQVLLTTQIYFDGDPSLQADGLFLDGGSENEHMVMELGEGQDVGGNPILSGEHDFVLNVDLSD